MKKGKRKVVLPRQLDYEGGEGEHFEKLQIRRVRDQDIPKGIARNEIQVVCNFLSRTEWKKTEERSSAVTRLELLVLFVLHISHPSRKTWKAATVQKGPTQGGRPTAKAGVAPLEEGNT